MRAFVTITPTRSDYINRCDALRICRKCRKYATLCDVRQCANKLDSFVIKRTRLESGALQLLAPKVGSSDYAWQNASRCPTEIPPINDAYCDWFNIVGSNGQVYNATTVSIIEGNMLALEAPVDPPVSGIRAVGTRYGWQQWPVTNYYNSAGFPVVPWNVTMA